MLCYRKAKISCKGLRTSRRHLNKLEEDVDDKLLMLSVDYATAKIEEPQVSATLRYLVLSVNE